MAIQIADIEGRTLYLLGGTGVAGTSINLNVTGLTTVVTPGTWQRWLPLFLVLTRFSTGNGAVPTATVTAGTTPAAAPADFKASGALSGTGPTQIIPALATISSYGQINNFVFAITAGAVGTCDVAVYGVIEAG